MPDLQPYPGEITGLSTATLSRTPKRSNRFLSWVLFVGGVSILPFGIRALVLWLQKGEVPDEALVFGHGELFIAALALCMDGAGDLMRRVEGGAETLILFIDIVIAFAAITLFSTGQLTLDSGQADTENNVHYRIAFLSLILFLCAFVVSSICKVLANATEV